MSAPRPADLLAADAFDGPAMEPNDLLQVVRSALGNPSGAALLAHLQRRFTDRALPPSASDAELRHLEGQRSVVVYLRHLVATSRRAPSGDLE